VLAQELATPRLLSVSLGVFVLAAIVIAALSSDLRAARRQADASASAVRRLQAVTDAALSHLGRDEMLGELLDRVQGLLDVDAAVVLLRDEHGGTLTVRARSGDATPPVGTAFPLGRGLVGRALTERQPMAVERLDPRDPAHLPWVACRLRSAMAAPLLADGHGLGVLCVGTRRGRSIDPDELRLVQLIADRITAALERARLYESERAARAAAQAAERSATFLAEASAVLDASLEEQAVLQALAGLCAPGLGDWCVIDVTEADRRLRRVAVTHADPSRAVAASALAARYPLSPDDRHGPGQVLRTGDIELIGGAGRSCVETLEDGDFRALLGELGVGAALAAPMPSSPRSAR